VSVTVIHNTGTNDKLRVVAALPLLTVKLNNLNFSIWSQLSNDSAVVFLTFDAR